jgi:hypothetical protein
MTCKEKLIAEHPKWDVKFIGMALRLDCPDDYGYAACPMVCDKYEYSCEECWDREVEDSREKHSPL